MPKKRATKKRPSRRVSIMKLRRQLADEAERQGNYDLAVELRTGKKPEKGLWTSTKQQGSTEVRFKPASGAEVVLSLLGFAAAMGLGLLGIRKLVNSGHHDVSRTSSTI